MHKNYNSCLHILDMHVERGRHQFSHRKQILVCVFYSSRIRTLVAMVTLSFHRLVMGKVEISYFM